MLPVFISIEEREEVQRESFIETEVRRGDGGLVSELDICSGSGLAFFTNQNRKEAIWREMAREKTCSESTATQYLAWQVYVSFLRLK